MSTDPASSRITIKAVDNVIVRVSVIKPTVGAKFLLSVSLLINEAKVFSSERKSIPKKDSTEKSKEAILSFALSKKALSVERISLLDS